jgi:uncharacterized phiE125 gp8 family phage protein
MGLKLITAPIEEPVTVAEAKANMKVEHSAEDTLIGQRIKAARMLAEHETSRAFITQTWEYAIDAFPVSEIRLPYPPLASVTSIKYDDTAGVEQTLSGAVYTIDTHSEPGWVLPVYGAEWPSTLAAANAVRIRYVVGYGDADDVPADAKEFILAYVSLSFEQRSPMLEKGSIDYQYLFRKLDRLRTYS